MSSTIYNTTTGQITLCVGLDNIPATDYTDSISGQWPGQAYYVDVNTREPVRIPSKPGPENYTWNPITKTWDLVP